MIPHPHLPFSSLVSTLYIVLQHSCGSLIDHHQHCRPITSCPCSRVVCLCVRAIMYVVSLCTLDSTRPGRRIFGERIFKLSMITWIGEEQRDPQTLGNRRIKKDWPLSIDCEVCETFVCYGIFISELRKEEARSHELSHVLYSVTQTLGLQDY